MATKETWPKVGLIWPDVHVPVEDKAAIRGALRYGKDLQPDVWGQLGDFMSLDCISDKRSLREVEGKRLGKDFLAGNLLLDQVQEAMPKAEKFIIQGNHDERMERYVDEHPELEGLLEVENALHLEDRGIEWVPFWTKGKIKTIGKANFIHGLYTNKYHAEKHVTHYGVNVFYGHVHGRQSYTLIRFGDNHAIVGESLGCLCRLDQGYMHGRPSNWQHAIATFWWWPNGNFDYAVTNIFGGKFVSPQGGVYDGNKS